MTKPTRSMGARWILLLPIGCILSATGIDAWMLDRRTGGRLDATRASHSRGILAEEESPSSVIGGSDDNSWASATRRTVLQRTAAAVAAVTSTAAAVPPSAFAEGNAATSKASEGAGNVPKFVQEYSDFVKSPRGYSYRNVPSPASATSSTVAANGDRVVFDWSGYTIGYFGRPFQAKGGPQGGAFDKDLDYARVVLGSHAVVGALELALEGMRAGEVRQVLVPYGTLSYPEDDPGHDRVGPKPSTFSGERALDFVLQNPRLDRTLLFNVKVIRVDKPNGKGGFVRG